MPQTKTTNTTTTPSANWGTALFSSMYSVLQTISSQLANLINPDQIEQIITALQAGKSVVLEIEDEIATKNFLLQLVTTNGQQQLGLVTTDGHCKILTGNWQRQVTDLVTKMRRQIIDISTINQTQTTTIGPKLIERSQTTITFYDAEAVESGSGKTITFTGEDREQKLQLYLTWLQSYQIEETQTATMPLTTTNLLVGTLAVTGTLLTGQIFRQGLTRTLDTMTDRFGYTIPGAVAIAGINSMLVESRQMPLAAALLSTLIYAQPSHAALLPPMDTAYSSINIANISGAIKISPVATTRSYARPVAGDFNGDGRADLAMATTDEEIDLIWGQSDDTTWPEEINLPGFVADGSKGSRIFLSGLGTTTTLTTAAQDTNQDGIADLIIGLRDENKVITIFGRHDFPATFNASQIPYGTGAYGFVVNGEAGSQFGSTVGGNNDFLMISAPIASPQNRTEAGITALIPSRSQWPTVVNISQVTDPTMAGTLFSGETRNDRSGSDVSIAMNRDDTYIFIGAYQADIGQIIKAGKVYAMRYNASLQGKEVTLSSQPTKENIVIIGSADVDKIGRKIVTLNKVVYRSAYCMLGTNQFLNRGAIWGFSLENATTIATNGTQISLGTYPQGSGFFNQTGYQSASFFGTDLAFIPNAQTTEMLAVGSPFENMAECYSAGGVYLFPDPLDNFGNDVIKLYYPCSWLLEQPRVGEELASLGNFYGSDRSSLYVSVTGLRIAYIVPSNMTFSSSSSSSSLSSSGSYASQSSSSQYASSSSTSAASSSGSTTSSSESSLASSSAEPSSASSSAPALSSSSSAISSSASSVASRSESSASSAAYGSSHSATESSSAPAMSSVSASVSSSATPPATTSSSLSSSRFSLFSQSSSSSSSPSKKSFPLLGILLGSIVAGGIIGLFVVGGLLYRNKVKENKQKGERQPLLEEGHFGVNGERLQVPPPSGSSSPTGPEEESRPASAPVQMTSVHAQPPSEAELSEVAGGDGPQETPAAIRSSSTVSLRSTASSSPTEVPPEPLPASTPNDGGNNPFLNEERDSERPRPPSMIFGPLDP